MSPSRQASLGFTFFKTQQGLCVGHKILWIKTRMHKPFPQRSPPKIIKIELENKNQENPVATNVLCVAKVAQGI